MQTTALFTCVMEPLPRASDAKWQPFQVVRAFLDGESDVLSEGCYYACRSSIDRYYRFLSRQKTRYCVCWVDEFRFDVFENLLSNCA